MAVVVEGGGGHIEKQCMTDRLRERCLFLPVLIRTAICQSGSQKKSTQAGFQVAAHRRNSSQEIRHVERWEVDDSVRGKVRELRI